jgi:hypothetical protein
MYYVFDLYRGHIPCYFLDKERAEEHVKQLLACDVSPLQEEDILIISGEEIEMKITPSGINVSLNETPNPRNYDPITRS